MPMLMQWPRTESLAGTSSDSSSVPVRNHILAALPSDDLSRFRPHLTRVSLVQKQVLFERTASIDHVFFIENGIISLVADTGDHDAGLEVGMIGPEGMAGFAVLFGTPSPAFYQAVVQMPGTALRMRVSAFRTLLEEMPALHQRCMRYLQSLMIQISQTAACNGRHTLQARCARWLLTAHERAGSGGLPLTQELLSVMLGVRRAGISVAVGALREAGCVENHRGRIVVLDEEALERAACACYRLARNEADRRLECV